MIANKYQDRAMRTMTDDMGLELSTYEINNLRYILGLAGECGEVVELFKKAIYHKHGLDRKKLQDELGDVLWYLTAIASNHGLSLDQIMGTNLDKLTTRYPVGFSPEDSIARRDLINE